MDKIRAIISAVLILRDAIEAVEQLFPQKGAGRWKLAAVLDIVAAKTSDILDDFAEIKPVIISLIEKVVDAKNALGDWMDAKDKEDPVA